MRNNIFSWLLLLLLLYVYPVSSQNSGPYIILTTINDTTDAYYQAVQTLSDYRNAQVITFDAGNVDALLPVLCNIEPRYVAVILKPLELHINLVRQFLMMSTNLDADPFSDFSYGFITVRVLSELAGY